VVSRSSLFDRIRERQYDDPHLLVLKDRVFHGDACHKDVSGFETILLVEENEERYSWIRSSVSQLSAG